MAHLVLQSLLAPVTLILLTIPFSTSSLQVASVFKSGAGFEIKEVLDQSAVAYGVYNDTVAENGWKVLEIVAGYSSTHFTDSDVMYAAGLLEGHLTQKDIYDMYTSLSKEEFSSHSSDSIEKVKEFYMTQREWTRMMITLNSNSSQLWHYAALIMAQFDGMIDGYSLQAPKSEILETFAFDFLAGNGDYLDIRNFVMPEARPDIDTLTKDQFMILLNKGHCSALIKVLPGYENIFAAHSSWYTYVAMNRIYKHYSFNTSNEFNQPPTKSMSFSSYPGYLSSLDDFYIMDSGLVMIQTTNNIFTKMLYDLSTPKALLAWHRVRLANWLANSGKEWAGIVAQYNSGTYNNQYMVLDMKQIELNKAIHQNALWIVEQIPGYVEYDDQTHILRSGYWPSYNVPFYEYIFQTSGYAAAEVKFGTDVSYDLCPRAKIFRRDQANVKDMESMQYIMRYNDYKNDIYSEGNPMNSICSRGDLGTKPSTGGCYDTKVTDFQMAKSMQAFAQNGPTHQNLPPFRWSSSRVDPIPLHLGQPDLFNFTFVLMDPINIP